MTIVDELLLSPSPHFEAAVISTASAAEAAKRRAESRVAAVRIAAKPLAASVQRVKKNRFSVAGKPEEVSAEVFLADALAESEDCDLEPLCTTLRLLAPMRQDLADKITSLGSALEELVAEADSVLAERKKYEAIRDKLEEARSHYLHQKEFQLPSAKALDEARRLAHEARGKLALAVSLEESRRATVLYRAAADAAEGYATFLRSAVATADMFEAAAATLRARAEQARSNGDAQIKRALSVVDEYAKCVDPLGSAYDDALSRGDAVGSGQNLGRSHDAAIRQAVCLGRGHVIKQGYLMKPAKGSYLGGWRRRWVVLDAGGTLTYYNDKHLIHASLAAEKERRGEEEEAPTPPSQPETPSRMRASWFGGGSKSKGVVEDDEEDEKKAKQTFRLQLSTVKLDGDPNDSMTRDVRNCFRIVSATHSLVLQAESASSRAEWVSAIQGAIAETITSGVAPTKKHATASPPPDGEGARVATALKAGPGNGACADCAAAEPDWASLNCAVLLCQQCAGVHRSLGTHVSKVRSVALDASSWAPPLVRLLARLGNDGAAAAWGAAAVAAEDSPREVKDVAIRGKYAERRHVPPHTAAAAAEPHAVWRAAAEGDAPRALCLLAAGAPLRGGAECPLLAAAARGEEGAEVAALLLVWGADALASDAEGRSLEEVAAAAAAPADGLLVPLLRAAAVQQGRNNAPPPPPPVEKPALMPRPPSTPFPGAHHQAPPLPAPPPGPPPPIAPPPLAPPPVAPRPTAAVAPPPGAHPSDLMAEMARASAKRVAKLAEEGKSDLAPPSTPPSIPIGASGSLPASEQRGAGASSGAMGHMPRGSGASKSLKQLPVPRPSEDVAAARRSEPHDVHGRTIYTEQI
ncbi:hypothetical protein AB1Y20_001118 [Prymnesium parvum]|uniref:Uncharacterized protein n=1 Tax=Prymnesium parvum TaxID=97485 RepID=A0AB34KA45_PRYPA